MGAFVIAFIMMVGISLSSVDFLKRSDERLLTPSLYPLKQKLLMNENVYDTDNSNLSPVIFAENLPDYESSFDVEYKSYQPGPTFDQFAAAVYTFGIENAPKQPYLYGSYEMY